MVGRVLSRVRRWLTDEDDNDGWFAFVVPYSLVAAAVIVGNGAAARWLLAPWPAAADIYYLTSFTYGLILGVVYGYPACVWLDRRLCGGDTPTG